MDKYEKSAIRLIDRLYKDLYLEDDVIRAGSGNKFDKFYNIKAYLDYLEDSHKKIIIHKHKNLLKQLYYDKYVIKKEDINEQYYINLKGNALEKGYGYIQIDKNKIQAEIIENQESSLSDWLDYLLSDDTRYPFWAKYWAFQGVLKIGSYDKYKNTFNKRTKTTIDSFIELNPCALSMSIDMLIKMFDKENFDDKQIELLIKSGSFAKIYIYNLNLLNKENNSLNNIDGKWIKYNQGSDSLELVKSLQGYNTGWCTARVSTAKEQLSMGDFYVYYTLDKNNEYKVPRIAIRMKNDNIAEICGIINIQDVEPELMPILEEKLQQFKDSKQYYKKINDMKLLTKIHKKHKSGSTLTKEELMFVYEINDKIVGFGKFKDPRTEEIIRQRNSISKDISCIFDGVESYKGNLNLKELKSSEELILSKYIDGSLNLSGLTNIDELILPEIIDGDLDLRNLISVNKLRLPKRVGGNLNLHSLKNFKELILPDKVGGNLILYNLTDISNIKFPNFIGGSLDLYSAVNISDVKLPSIIKGNLDLNSLANCENIEFPKYIGGSLNLYNLKSINNVVFPIDIGYTLDLRTLESIKNSKLPINIGKNLDLSSLKYIELLELPKNIGGNLSLKNLKQAYNLDLSINIGENLYLNNLLFASNLSLPQSMNGIVFLNRLNGIKGLVIPKNFNYKIKFKLFKVSSKNLIFVHKSKVKKLLLK